MTGEDFNQRLRRVEDWCLQHDERCNGRDQRLVASIESLKKSLEKETAAGKSTEARVDALRDSFADFKIKMAFIAGLSAAGGGILGSFVKDLF